jgi:hypothetical protein
MIAVYTESGVEHKMSLEDFIKQSFVSDDRPFGDDYNSRAAASNRGHMAFTVNLVDLLVKKGLLSVQEIQELLPHSNYRTLVKFADEW